MLDAASCGGNFEVIKWLVDILDNTELTRYRLGSMLKNACINGCLDIAKYIVRTFRLPPDMPIEPTHLILGHICRGGEFGSLNKRSKPTQLEIIKWIVETFNLTEEVIRNVCS